MALSTESYQKAPSQSSSNHNSQNSGKRQALGKGLIDENYLYIDSVSVPEKTRRPKRPRESQPEIDPKGYRSDDSSSSLDLPPNRIGSDHAKRAKTTVLTSNKTLGARDTQIRGGGKKHL